MSRLIRSLSHLNGMAERFLLMLIGCRGGETHDLRKHEDQQGFGESTISANIFDSNGAGVAEWQTRRTGQP